MDDDLKTLAVPILMLLAAIGFCLWLAGCADPCHGNPRNMQCMTPAQLEKELNQ